MGYNTIEPISPQRHEASRALIGATLFNQRRRRGQSPLKVKDLVPVYGDKPQQTWQEQLKIVEALNKAFGGKDLRRNQ